MPFPAIQKNSAEKVGPHDVALLVAAVASWLRGDDVELAQAECLGCLEALVPAMAEHGLLDPYTLPDGSIGL